MPLKPECVETELDKLWKSNWKYLRRLLVSLTRDPDLADDLLQETQLRALKGIAGYRGGDARAWLSAIAKNVFYVHARRKYYSSEVPLDHDPALETGEVPGSVEHIDILAVRQAVSELPKTLRVPLIMKHYGDLTYSQIAERLSLPQGTVQQRVWTGLQRLKSSLGVVKKELTAMRCDELMGRLLIDYVYGKLAYEEARKVREHLKVCPSCREEAQAIGETLRALDAVEGAFKWTSVLELDEKGFYAVYAVIVLPNESDQPVETFEFNSGRDTEVTYTALNGDEAHFKELPAEPGYPNRKWVVRPPTPIPPRQPVEFLTVSRSVEKAIEELGPGYYRFGPGKLNLSEDMVYVMAMRLPKEARLIEATPEPQEIRKNGVTTVIWRNVLAANTEFSFWVEYELKLGKDSCRS